VVGGLADRDADAFDYILPLRDSLLQHPVMSSGVPIFDDTHALRNICGTSGSLRILLISECSLEPNDEAASSPL
jgi:hypothetical protein